LRNASGRATLPSATLEDGLGAEREACDAGHHAGEGFGVAVVRQPRSAAGAAAIASLTALSASVREADERALQQLQMRSLDALALSHLVEADADGARLNPSQLSRILKVSTAAVTKLVDRLVAAGRVERHPNPQDRRGIVLVPAGSAIDDVAQAYGHVRTPVVEAIDELSDAEAAIVDRFAARLAQRLQIPPTA
jgi:DNA-binding MarR family transcriptional regulator